MKGENIMKETVIMNAISVTVCGLAIAVGCKVSKSAWPLLAMMLIPRWKYEHTDKKGA